MQFQNVLYFLLWAGLFFAMMRFACGAHVMGHGHHHRGSDSDDHPYPAGGPWQTPAQSIDPVCGKTVDTATAKSAAYRGRVYYFCSQDCRETFEATPSSYAKITTEASPGRHHHGC